LARPGGDPLKTFFSSFAGKDGPWVLRNVWGKNRWESASCPPDREGRTKRSETKLIREGGDLLHWRGIRTKGVSLRGRGSTLKKEDVNHRAHAQHPGVGIRKSLTKRELEDLLIEGNARIGRGGIHCHLILFPS